MLRAPHVPLPVPEPLALLDATLIFLIQVLIAQQPELLSLPEAADTHRQAHPLRAARHIVDAVREVHYALDTYRTILPDPPGYMSQAEGETDEIPF
jgi:hypothetical protein